MSEADVNVDAGMRAGVGATGEAARGPHPASGSQGELERERLRSMHRELELRLAALERHRFLSPTEQIERSRLKKEKLRIKDRLSLIAGSAAATPPR
jgi:uncharacterized protein YdcH (DUF465 family)